MSNYLGDYFIGEFSLVDIMYAPHLTRIAANLPVYRGYQIPGNDRFPNLNRWLGAIDSRPAYDRVKSDSTTNNLVKATREIHKSYPLIKIMVLTTFNEDEYIWRSLQAGALGYLLKNTPSQQITAAIRTLDQGHCQLDSTVAAKVFAQINPPVLSKQRDYHHLFSDRELEILKLLGKGKNHREIAQTLHLTEGTVKNYITNIFCQLGVRDRTQAALWAKQNLV